jgi:hypothetical protein
MYVARWSLTARFGHTDAVLALIRKWEIDVGQRVGWRPGSTRIAVGAIGPVDTSIEFEVRVDNIADLESAWADMEAIPYHKAYSKELEPLVVSGTTRWSVYRLVDLHPEAS